MQHQFSTDTLLLYAAGMIEPARSVTASIEAHLRECTRCAAVVGEARSVASMLRDQDSRIVDPPAHVATMAESLFAAIRPDLVPAVGRVATHSMSSAGAAETPLGGIRRVLANLTFDSVGSVAFAGLRAGGAASRHLSYQSELGDLDLQVTPPQRPSAVDALWHLMGQLHVPDPLPIPASITFARPDLLGIGEQPERADVERIMADIDPRGYFTVELQAGTWSASMVMDQAALVVPDITL